MKMLKTLIAGVLACALVTGTVLAAEKTGCQKTKADGKDCTRPCCVAAHKAGKSCEKCNPNREDLRKTCCEAARADGKECPHKCCVVAHKDGQSCEKCNPNKEDLKQGAKKDEKKDEKKAR